eukprot:365302-Chlamydomonas_euryale.AAC.5
MRGKSTARPSKRSRFNTDAHFSSTPHAEGFNTDAHGPPDCRHAEGHARARSPAMGRRTAGMGRRTAAMCRWNATMCRWTHVRPTAPKSPWPRATTGAPTPRYPPAYSTSSQKT